MGINLKVCFISYQYVVFLGLSETSCLLLPAFTYQLRSYKVRRSLNHVCSCRQNEKYLLFPVLVPHTEKRNRTPFIARASTSNLPHCGITRHLLKIGSVMSPTGKLPSPLTITPPQALRGGLAVPFMT